MPDPKKFTVMELADAVGVPRTTINDWLGKYAMYIDSAMQGRRRIYSDASLAVLKMIAALRDRGLSSVDIERELAKTCPVHPQMEPEKPSPEPVEKTVFTPPKPKPEPEPESRTAAAPVQEIRPDEPPASELVLRRNADEVFRRFQEMMDKIDRLEKAAAQKRPSSHVSTVLLVLTLMLILAGFGGGAWFALKHLETMKDRTAKLEDQLQSGEQTNLALRENVLTLAGKVESGEKVNQALRDNVISLDRGSREYQKNLDRLTRELEEEKQRAKQQTATEAALRRSESERKDLELEKQKQENARLRLEFMRRLEEENAKAEKAIEETKKAFQKKAAAQPVKTDVKPATPVKPEVKPATPVKPEVKPATPVKPEVKPATPVKAEIKPATPVKAEIKPATPPVKTDVRPALDSH